MISRQVTGERTAGWGREGHGRNYGQTTGIHVGNWEVSAAPCTAQMDASFKQLLSHQKTVSKTFCHSLLLGDYYILNVLMKNPNMPKVPPTHQTVVACSYCAVVQNPLDMCSAASSKYFLIFPKISVCRDIKMQEPIT